LSSVLAFDWFLNVAVLYEWDSSLVVLAYPGLIPKNSIFDSLAIFVGPPASFDVGGVDGFWLDIYRVGEVSLIT